MFKSFETIILKQPLDPAFDKTTKLIQSQRQCEATVCFDCSALYIKCLNPRLFYTILTRLRGVGIWVRWEQLLPYHGPSLARLLAVTTCLGGVVVTCSIWEKGGGEGEQGSLWLIFKAESAPWQQVLNGALSAASDVWYILLCEEATQLQLLYLILFIYYLL